MKNAAEPIVWTDDIFVTLCPTPIEFPLFAHCLLSEVRGDFERTKEALIKILEGRAARGWLQNTPEPSDFYSNLYRSLIPVEPRKRRP
jgi:hypothetical protein